MHKAVQTDIGSGVNLTYIITPFLDMSFQLLAFFIMTYHPSALEGQVEGTLTPPAHARSSALGNSNGEWPVDEPPRINETLLVKIKAVAAGQEDAERREGEPRQLLLQQPHDAQPVLISDVSAATLDKGLKKLDVELQRIRKQPGASEWTVKIEADGELRHQYVLRVYDSCKKAGFEKISFVAPKLKK